MAAAAPAKPSPAKQGTGAGAGTQKPAPGKTPNAKKKTAGRPRRSLASRAITGYKTYATGVTRNSPYTDPNIIFWVGLSLILLSGWSSGRLKTIILMAWGGGDAGSFLSAIKSEVAQLIFVFVLVVLSRAIPPFARVALVLMLGFGLLWLIKNPQIVQLLAAFSAGQTEKLAPSQGYQFVL